VIRVTISNRPPDTKNISKVVVLNGDGEVLLLLRKKDQPFPRKWDLPGGHLVVGETWEEGAVREVKEETNLDLGDLEMILDKGKNKYFKTSSFIGEVFNKKDLPEHDDFMWASPESIDALDITKIYINAIRSALK
jgi:ADP-ribose pyrophosphatase YjhB (NUDIX family)